MKTWNPITGCLHNCIYCWARNYAKRLASWGTRPYKNHGFKPTFAEWRLRQKLPKGDIFVSDMGYMWGEWVPKDWIKKVLKQLKSNTRSQFLFLTKNPRRYHDFKEMFTENMMLGATIETNRNYRVSKAPPPKKRFFTMRDLNWRHKTIVIEPILDFDLEFIDWIKEISPETVTIGYDNYKNRLPEPQLDKTKALVRELGKITELTIRASRKAWYEK